MREKVNYKDCSIEVNSLGAELKSFCAAGKEYIWCSDPKYWKRSAPFLFPIVGSVKNKEIYIDGKRYEMGQHGFLRDQEFKVVKKEEGYIALETYSNDQTKIHYPYDFKALVEYFLKDNELETKITITSYSDEMCFNFGGHPAFNCPMDNNKFEDYRIVFEKPETFNSPSVEEGGLLDFNKGVYQKENCKEIKLTKDIFTIDTILIRDIKSKKVMLLDNNNQGIEFSFPKFSTLAIWTPYNDAPFICLEPWIGYNDLVDTNQDYKTKNDLIYLNKGESFFASYKVKVIK